LPTDSRPLLDAGEYSFAASGTGIRCYGESRVIISTGGTVSRLWSSEDNGGSWTASQTPIIQGLPTAGIFSFTFLTGERAIIVGGDFQRDSLMMDHVFYSTNGGAEWKAPTAATRGYRECVEVLDGNEVIATGPGGTDISYDGGEHWSALWDERGFHVVRKARNGTLALMAGGGGKLAILE